MSILFFPVISAIINRPVGIAEATHLTCVPLCHKHLASACHQVPSRHSDTRYLWLLCLLLAVLISPPTLHLPVPLPHSHFTVLYQMVGRTSSSTGWGEKNWFKLQSWHQNRQKLSVGEAGVSACWYPAAQKAGLQLRVGPTMSVSKLPLHIDSLKFQPSKSQQEDNLVGVQAHPFHEVSLHLPPGKPWLQNYQQPSVQLPAQWASPRLEKHHGDQIAQQAGEGSGLRHTVWAGPCFRYHLLVKSSKLKHWKATGIHADISKH